MRSHITFSSFTIRISALLLFSAVVCFLALNFGVLKVSTGEVIRVIGDSIGLVNDAAMSDIKDETIIVIRDLRLKRVYLAFLIGLALAVSGCTYQALLRNPLADPHIIGVSSGGALGAVVASALSIPLIGQTVFAVPLFAFLGSSTAMAIVYNLSKRNGALSMYSLLLIGVILNSFFIAIVIFIQTIISADQLASIFFWLLGSLYQYHDELIPIVTIVVAICVGVIFFHARSINILTLGEDRAQTLGVDVEKTKQYLFIAASIATGLAVAVSGLVGFVGLVVPHIVRLIFGSDHRIALPASALCGGIFMVVADTIARTILLPQEIPVGVVTSFIGAPFFIILLKQREKKRLV